MQFSSPIQFRPSKWTTCGLDAVSTSTQYYGAFSVRELQVITKHSNEQQSFCFAVIVGFSLLSPHQDGFGLKLEDNVYVEYNLQGVALVHNDSLKQVPWKALEKTCMCKDNITVSYINSSRRRQCTCAEGSTFAFVIVCDFTWSQERVSSEKKLDVNECHCTWNDD